MKASRNILTGVLLFAALAACQNPASPSGSSEDSAAYSIYLANGSVFVSGQYWDGSQWNSCYWQDGVMTPTGGIVARSIYVDGGNVYTAGTAASCVGDSGCGEYPFYWQGSSPTQQCNVFGNAYSIFISGGTVYTAGRWKAITPTWGACYWQGTTLYQLPGSTLDSYDAYSVFVSGGTVYTGGQFYNQLTPATPAFLTPCTWTGGTRSDLEPVPGSVYSVYFYGGSLYAAGQYFDGKKWTAGFWIGTTFTMLSGVSANSIFIDSGTVYATGEYSVGTNWVPCYWTGTTRTDLPGASTDTFVGSIFVLGGTVYTAGYYYDGKKYVACYWTGTTRTDLPGMTVPKSINPKSVSSLASAPLPAVGEGSPNQGGEDGSSRRPR